MQYLGGKGGGGVNFRVRGFLPEVEGLCRFKGSCHAVWFGGMLTCSGFRV